MGTEGFLLFAIVIVGGVLWLKRVERLLRLIWCGGTSGGKFIPLISFYLPVYLTSRTIILFLFSSII